MPDRGGLTAFQVRVARAFFDLELSQGFYLAGGAALIARDVVSRRTQDLDLFTTRGVGDVAEAQAALVALAEREGWTCVVKRSVPGFARLALREGAGDELLVDLAEDAPPLIQPGATFLGPTLVVGGPPAHQRACGHLILERERVQLVEGPVRSPALRVRVSRIHDCPPGPAPRQSPGSDSARRGPGPRRSAPERRAPEVGRNRAVHVRGHVVARRPATTPPSGSDRQGERADHLRSGNRAAPVNGSSS